MGTPRLPGILVVDDDEAIRLILRETLEDQGYVVFEAPDGMPALERLRTHPTGLVVLLDLMMPGTDGFAVLQAMSTEARLTEQHTVILMTAAGWNLPHPVITLLSQLSVPVLHKPFSLDALLTLVEQAVARLPPTAPT